LVDTFTTLPRADDASYFEHLGEAIEAHNIEALFCGSEAELQVWTRNRRLLDSFGAIVGINAVDAVEIGMNKGLTTQFLQDQRFNAPRSRLLMEVEDVTQIDFFPIIVKPFRASGGSRDVFIAQSPEELLGLSSYLPHRDFLIQEYVGRPENEYTVGVLHDLDGEFVNSIAMRRLLSTGLNVRTSVTNETNRHDLGPSLVVSSGVSHGYVGEFREVTETCEAIARSLKSVGPLNIQCRLVGTDVYVFEINPRFSGTTSIRALMGFNEPDLLIRRHLFGETLPVRFPYRSGLVLRSLQETIIREGTR
jgi:carbamoyl-phosphate synthase large subunit